MRLIDADAFKEYITDGFKYIMTEFKTDRVRDLAYQVTYDFCRDIDEAPTVNAIPIEEVLKIIEFEEKWLSQTRMSICDIEIAFSAMKSKIKQIEGSDAE